MLSAKTQPVYNLFGESLQATLHIGHSHEKHISLFIKLSVYTECCKYSLSTSAQLQLLDDKLLTLLLMPLQVDVIVGRWQIHRLTVNTSICDDWLRVLSLTTNIIRTQLLLKI